MGSQLQMFPPWKSGKEKRVRKIIISITYLHIYKIFLRVILASGIRNIKDNHVTPRPFWSNITKNKETRLTLSHVNKTIALPLI